MASTRNLAASAKFALPLLNYQPIQIAGDDPALTAANLTKQTILGAPFDWRFNRTEMMLPLVPATQGNLPSAGQQDYIIPAPNFGFLSRVILKDANGRIVEIEIRTSLSPETLVQRPQTAAAQFDDNQGNITLRFNSIPDQPYTAFILYQHKPVPMTSMAATWAPIPDELSYIYDWLFVAYLSLLVKDARMPIYRQMGLAHLIGAQDGLDETQRNIFLGNFVEVIQTPIRAQARAQQGMAARQV